ncbi:zinc metalloproteinase nas-13-like [Tubulanus polymorphus]|uniref:zinc metalloproteinase nas-13-like n=1 Tax=Tubulanus polymorphus TaxID=672921 RepID=UPI003DA5ADF0
MELWILIITLLGVVQCYDDGNYLETDPDLFEGDMILPPGTFRNAVKYKRKKWPQGTVPYEIDHAFDASQKKKIREALEIFKKKTQCIMFRPRLSSDTNYLFIKRYSKSCSSNVGMVGGRQVTKLADGCVNVQGIILHEMMHVIGFMHEQTRPDRNKYIFVKWRNIKESAWWNFRLLPADSVDMLDLPYDYGSLMHYGDSYFAKEKGSKTIEILEPNVKIGQRERFSDLDLKKIKKLYAGHCYA